jgi:Thiamine pyrophosphate enzyme, C-terminal TPP binding domain
LRPASRCEFTARPEQTWIDGTYDMVAEQELIKYGRTSGVKLGPIDPIKYAEAFGATGMMIRTPEDIAPGGELLKRPVRFWSACLSTIATTANSSRWLIKTASIS